MPDETETTSRAQDDSADGLTARPFHAGNERFWLWAAVAAGIAALGVRVYLAWGADHPSFPFDEVSTLQMTRMLAGEDVPLVRGAGYFPGWSLVLVPLAWVITNPFALYSAALAVGIAVSMLTAWPLARLGTRFGLTAPQAAFAAFATLTIPAWSVQAGFALAEQLVFLLMASAALAVWRFHERPTVWRAVTVAAVIAAAYFTHVRLIVIVGATAVWLLLNLFNRRWAAAAGLGALVVLSVAAHWAGTTLNETLLGHAMDQGENTRKNLFTAPPLLIVKVMIAQAWSQVAATFGVVAIGVVGVFVLAWRTIIRKRDFGPIVWILGVLVASAGVSVAAWSNYGTLFTASWLRLDVWVYERYLNHITGLVVMIGIALTITRVRESLLRWSLGLQVALILATLVVIAPIASTWGYVTPAHIPGMMPWYSLLPDSSTVGLLPEFTNDNRFWLWASLTSLVIPILTLILRTRIEMLACLLIAVTTVASIASHQGVDDFRALEGTPPATVLDVQAVIEQHSGTVAYDTACQRSGHLDAVGMNYFGWWVLPGVMALFDGDTEPVPDVDVIIGCDSGSPPYDGAVRVSGTEAYQSVMWVMPGAVADALVGTGATD